jgi:2-methylisocitrate lyase-like PEP mutase family enzyme
LDDTIRRLQAFEKAGADVLFAPGLPEAAVGAVCAAVPKPVNFMGGGSKEDHFPWVNSPRPESGASASRPHAIARQ